MGKELETKMTSHIAKEFWGGDRKGVCIQITCSDPIDPSKDLLNQEGYIQLTMEEANALCQTLSKFICDEAKRRQQLLREQLEQLKLNQKTVFHEIINFDNSYFPAYELSVEMISKFCPKSKQQPTNKQYGC
jgi:hypothetical protein